MPVHKNTTCALQTGYKPTCLCIKTQHVHFKKAINPHACAQNTHPEPSIKYQNLLKPTCLCTKNEHQRPRRSRRICNPKAQRWGGTPLTRPRSFASPARSHARHEHETKAKSISRFGGCHKGELTPLNLWYIVQEHCQHHPNWGHAGYNIVNTT